MFAASARGTLSATCSRAEPREVDRRGRRIVDVRLRAREREQLARRAAGTGRQALDVDQRFAHAVRARIGKRALGLQAQARERRAQLMRGVGDEAILQFEQAAQAREQEIDRVRQRPDLDRHDALVERRQITRAAARRDARVSGSNRCRPRRTPNQTRISTSVMSPSTIGSTPIEDLARERAPLAQRLRDRDHDDVAGVVAGDRKRGHAQAAARRARSSARRGFAPGVGSGSGSGSSRFDASVPWRTLCTVK